AMALGLCATAMSPRARAQLRTDLIEAARTEKASSLTPETPPKAERIIVGVERSVPYRLLTGEINGFGVGYGTIVPGAGFAIGPHYRRDDLFDGRLTFRAEARAAINKSYIGRIDLAYAPLFTDRAGIALSVVHRNISEMPYYGAGPASRKTGRSDFR